MYRVQNVWAIVLAAGDGCRMGSLTLEADGVRRPKQFCAFGTDRTLLRRALDRAAALVPLERIVAVVAERHRRWWARELWMLPSDNIVAQPENRGTAPGILLPLLHLLRRDPDAIVVVLPSDHFVVKEHLLRATIRQAVRDVRIHPGDLVLLGITPDSDDPDYGWILPLIHRRGKPEPVRAFVEKPGGAVAAQLRGRGGLWNSFLFVVRATTLQASYERSMSGLVDRFSEWVCDAGPSPTRLEKLYGELPTSDFSRDLLEAAAESLRVIPVPACGWTDLGTPGRVSRWLAAMGRVSEDGSSPRSSATNGWEPGETKPSWERTGSQVGDLSGHRNGSPARATNNARVNPVGTVDNH